MSVTLPFSQSTACAAVWRPTAWSQAPEMPTTWPRSLIAVAAVEVSPGSGGSSRIWSPGPQTTARNCRTCGGTQVGSCTVFSAQPTTCPRLLAPVAKPLLPPSVGSARITPSSQTNPRQVKPVAVAAGEEGRAAPILPQRLRRGGLRDPHEHAVGVLDRPGDAAVGAAEGAEVERRAVQPERGVPALVPRQVRVARDPAPVVDAVPAAHRAAERGEVGDAVLRAQGSGGQQRREDQGSCDERLHDCLLRADRALCDSASAHPRR